MKKNIALLLLLLPLLIFGQAPGQFNYQTVVTNPDGSTVRQQQVRFRISLIQGVINGTPVYTETQLDTTNAYGLVMLAIGKGAPVAGSFGAINWGRGPYFMKIELDPAGGTDYHYMGTSQLLSVPYSLFAETVREVRAPEDLGPDEPIFQVTNQQGEVLFGVYSTGVRVVLDETALKGGRGGFVVGGRAGKGATQEYLVLNRDTALFTIDDSSPIVKGSRGGFAVGGRGSSKAGEFKYMDITGDNTNFYLRDKGIDQASNAFNILAVTSDNQVRPIMAVSKDSASMSTSLNVQDDLKVGGGVTANSVDSRITSIIDTRDGQKYAVTNIGKQVWMAENLRATHFMNGDPVPVFDGYDESGWNSLITGVRTYYENDSLRYGQKYGGLYNYFAITDPRKLCPVGWHIPSKADWDSLVTYLGGTDVAGGKLKSTESGIWSGGMNVGATNETGFSALPGGYSPRFEQMGKYGYFWSSTPSNASQAYCLVVNYDGKHVVLPNDPNKNMGFSVRCLKD